jgi:hypothetical protein
VCRITAIRLVSQDGQRGRRFAANATRGKHGLDKDTLANQCTDDLGHLSIVPAIQSRGPNATPFGDQSRNDFGRILEKVNFVKSKHVDVVSVFHFSQ